MTQEEKAQRYDEAIKVAKSKIKNDKDHVLYEDDVIDIFPELKESEDKKIISAIRKAIEAKVENLGNGVTRTACLSWLEKQSYTKKDVDDAYLKGVIDTKNEIEKQYEANYQIRKDIATFIFNYKGDIKDRAKWMNYLGIKVSFAEKQGEQKYIPKYNIGDEIKTANEEPLTITKIDEKGYWSEDLFICGFDDTAKWEVVGQKTAWSEEDEKIGKELMDFCIKCSQGHTIVNSQDDFRRWTTWLKSLKPQLKNEWSKEDEREVAVLEAYIRSKDWSESHIDRALGIVDELVNKAKSLIPQNTWKPSEHELEVLKLVAEKDGTCLMGLYKQLKKLREE